MLIYWLKIEIVFILFILCVKFCESGTLVYMMVAHTILPSINKQFEFKLKCLVELSIHDLILVYITELVAWRMTLINPALLVQISRRHFTKMEHVLISLTAIQNP